jgi:hypothetical protein
VYTVKPVIAGYMQLVQLSLASSVHVLFVFELS